MRPIWKAWATLLVVLIGASAFGLGQVAGPLVVLVFVVGILLLIIIPSSRRDRPGRPPKSGRRKGLQSVAQLGWYKTDALAFPSAILVGQAWWNVAEAGFPDGTTGTVAVSVGIVGLALLAIPGHVGDSLSGVAGLGAIAVQLQRSDACREALTGRETGVILVAALVMGLGIGALRFVGGALPGFPRLRAVPSGLWPLIAFAIIELMVFVFAPGGVWIWVGAPGWTAAAVVAGLVAITLVAGFAPRFVLFLVAVGVAVADIALTMAQLQDVSGAGLSCMDAERAIVFLLVFLPAGMIVKSLAR